MANSISVFLSSSDFLLPGNLFFENSKITELFVVAAFMIVWWMLDFSWLFRLSFLATSFFAHTLQNGLSGSLVSR